MSETEKDIEIDFDAIDKLKAEAEIKIEDAEPEEKPVPPEIPAEEGIEKLQKNLESEREARLQAEMRAEQALRQVQEAQKRISDSDLMTVKSAIDTLTREKEILKANLRNAMASGDYSAAADVQEALTKSQYQLEQLDAGRKAMEEEIRNPVRRVEPPPMDPVEAFASQLSPRSAAWVRAHPEYARNPRLTQKMIAAHNFVTADGLAPDTDEYFESVERVLGMQTAPNISAAAAEAPMSAAAAPAQRRSSPAAAPVSRSGNAGNTRPNVVRLSLEEREMASMVGQTPEEYARHKHALKKAGKITSH